MLAEWQRFEAVFGPILIHERIDVAAALIAYHTAGQPGRSVKDFLPQWGPRSDDDMLSTLFGLAGRMGEGDEA